MLDVPGLHELLTKLHRRELSVVEVETSTASPFASSLLFDYVATYMYEGDTPNAERRAAALSLDRDLLRELLGQDELRELIDPGALDEVEADLQHRSDRMRAGSSDALGDILRRIGDLTRRGGDRARARGRRRRRAARRAAPRAPRDRRSASRARSAGSRPTTPASTATRSESCRPADCRRRSSTRSTVRSRSSSPATRARTARSRPLSCARATALIRRRRCERSKPRAGSCAANCARRQRARVVRRRRPAPDPARVARRAAQGDRGRRSTRAGELPAELAGRRPPSRRRRRDRPAARGAGSASGARAAGAGLGARRAAAARRRVLAGLARSAHRLRRARLGRRRRERAQLRPRRALLPRRRRGDRPAGDQGPGAGAAVASPSHEALRERLAASPCFFTDLLAELPAFAPEELQDGALGSRLGGRGDERRLRAAARAAPDAGPRTA